MSNIRGLVWGIVTNNIKTLKKVFVDEINSVL